MEFIWLKYDTNILKKEFKKNLKTRFKNNLLSYKIWIWSNL